MADIVTCPCGIDWDRELYAQCEKNGCDLYTLDPMDHPRPHEHERPTPPTGTTNLESPDQSAPQRIRLRVTGRSLDLSSGDRIELGREDHLTSSPLFAKHLNVSRFHANIRFDAGRLYVTDVSANGTFVDDHRLPKDEEYEVHRGQRLRFASNVPVDIEWE